MLSIPQLEINEKNLIKIKLYSKRPFDTALRPIRLSIYLSLVFATPLSSCKKTEKKKYLFSEDYIHKDRRMDGDDF